MPAFTFDGLDSVSSSRDLLDNMYCADNGLYFETPVSFYGLARSIGLSPWHESALYFKRNVLSGCFIPHQLPSRQAFSAFALDWFVFGNGYLEIRGNRLDGQLRFRQSLAKYTRRVSDLENYWFVEQWQAEHQFTPGSSATSSTLIFIKRFMVCRNTCLPCWPLHSLMLLTRSENCITTMDRTRAVSFTSVQVRSIIKAWRR